MTKEGHCSHDTFLLNSAYESLFDNEQKTSTRWQQHHSQPVWQQQLCESRLLTWHWSVSGKDYIQYLICWDRSGRCCPTHSLQLCCRCKIWMTEISLYKKKAVQPALHRSWHTPTPPHSPASFTLRAHSKSVAGGQTVFRHTVLLLPQKLPCL